jgi:protoheme IX farnesyltransferase
VNSRTEVQVKATWRDYLTLTKPRIIELLLVTTIPTMMMAAQGLPALSTAIATLVGGTLAAGGANVLNCYLDMDIDAIMPRTAHRATASGLIGARQTVVFGLSLSLAAIVILGTFTNGLAASLAALAIIFYVGVYSLLLKRRTKQNIVWGGIAGSFPVVIGWSAVTGTLTWEPWVLFIVVFLWTPPHYWPLAINFKEEYAAANVPMLPVVASDEEVVTQIIRYSWVMVLTSLALIPAGGLVYAVLAGTAGIWFMVSTYRLRYAVRNGVKIKKAAMAIFHGSITYLSVIFLAVGLSAFF